jgi:hypothetical protein
MSILTGRELEFLASLRTSWSRLYWNELARLLKEDDDTSRVAAEPEQAAGRVAWAAAVERKYRKIGDR